MSKKNAELLELRIVYDAYNDTTVPCTITTANANKTCTLNITIPHDLDPPILIHYEITNFYQNQRKYLNSRDDIQLRGEGNSPRGQELCRPLTTLGSITLNPCGLIANTLFNDILRLVSGNDAEGNPLYMNETTISWKSDVESKFRQPKGFEKEQCASCDDVNCSCSVGGPWSCSEPYRDSNGNCWKYYYPDENTTQYLYEVSEV